MSALTDRLIQSSREASRVFSVRAPVGGSTDPARFEHAVEVALGVSLPLEQALSALPAGSAVVVHDLELWFGRHAGGLAVIDTLARQIDRAGDRVLFVVTCNEYTFTLLRRLGRLDDQVIATVHCPPLDAGSLREAVLRRHESSGLGLRLIDGPEAAPGEFAVARMFHGLFGASGGYVGPALHAWIGLVERFEHDAVVLRRPRAVDLDALDALEDTWVALLLELVLHRSLSLTRLVRVTGADEAALRRHVLALVRSGLVEDDGVTLRVDPYAAHHVHYWLARRGVL